MEKSQTSPNWKELYQAAVLETNPQLAVLRIADAEHAIVERALAIYRDDSRKGTNELANELKSLAYSANFLSELRRIEISPITVRAESSAPSISSQPSSPSA